MRSGHSIDFLRKSTLALILVIGTLSVSFAQCSTILTDSINPTCGSLNNGSAYIFATSATPAFQYKIGINGTWQSSNIFSNLAAGIDSFYVEDTAACVSLIVDTITSLGSPFVPNITASALHTTFCAGSSLINTFSASSSGSAVLTYQWYQNGSPISGATSSTYTTSTLSDNDSLWVIGRSTSPCALPDSAVSNKIYISILPITVPSISIAASATSYCTGASFVDSFWINGGTSAVLNYQWYINGVSIPGAQSSSYWTSSLSDNDSIWVIIHSSASCASPDSAISNHIIVSITNCPPDTVWPGDADADHIADNNDLLTIGLGYSATGPVRVVQGIVWQADTVTRWGQYFTIYAPTVNYDHADCNGDGIINADDTLAVVTNFGLTHAKSNGYRTPRTGIPNMYLQFSQDSVTNGDTLTNSISLGDLNLPVAAIYGLSFIYNYDPSIYEPSSISFGYVTSWLGDQVNSINIAKNFIAPGQVKTAITGIDHLDRNGYGDIAKFRGTITTDNINGLNKAPYHNISFISDLVAVDHFGNPVQINETIDSSVILLYPTGIAEAATGGSDISVFPNPSTGQIKIISTNDIMLLEVYDIVGNLIEVNNDANKRIENIDLTGLANGVYIVHVSTRNSTKDIKLILSR